MDKCIKCGATEEVALQIGNRCMDQVRCLTRQLAAANAKLQERGEAFERAREARKRVHVLAREAEWTIIDAYFATGEKEG